MNITACYSPRNASVDQKKHPSDQSVNKTWFGKSLMVSKGIAFSAFFAPSVLVVRITALTVSIFGNPGKNLSKKIHVVADKLKAILLVHNFHNLSILFESRVLIQTKNIATKSSIWREEDLKKSREFIKLILNPEYCKKKGLAEQPPSEVAELKKYLNLIKGANTDGICFGASLIVIKSLLSTSIKTEKDLIDFFDQYKNGFPAEAAALQNVHEAFIGDECKFTLEEQNAMDKEVEKAIQDFRNEVDGKQKDLENRQNSLSREEYTQLFLQLIKDTEEANPRKIEDLKKSIKQLHYFKNKSSKLERMACLIDLKLKYRIEKHDRACFTGIMREKNVQDKFNQLKNGYYQLLFRTSATGAHAIVYIKKEFGSYFLDPTFGLIKCMPDTPANKLCELFKKHYKGKPIENKQREQFLEIFHFQV